MLKREKYAVRDGMTRFNAADMNPIFWDIDGRLHTLEGLKVQWEAAVADIQQHGLERINSVIAPVLDEAGASLGEIQAELTSLQAQVAAFVDWWDGQGTAITEFLQVQAAAFVDWWDGQGAAITELQNRTLLEHKEDGTHKYQPLGFITGLTHAQKDADEVTFDGGAIEINGVVYYLPALTDVQFTGLSASTWVYIYVAAPTEGHTLSDSDFSADDTAPVRDHAKGGAWYNAAGDKRCIGFFLTDGSGDIVAYYTSRGDWSFKSGNLILGTSSPAINSWTALSADVPALGRMPVKVSAKFQDLEDDGAAIFITGGDKGSYNSAMDAILSLTAYQVSGNRIYASSGDKQVLTNTSGQIGYSASTGDEEVSIYVHHIGIPEGMAG